MNEKIRQLAEQSQLWDRLDPRSLGIPGGSTESRWGEELQEFAELIVRECIKQVEPTQHHEVWAQSYLGGVDGLDLLYSKVKEIKRHFGVE
jgi:hypothetical protein